MLTYNFDRVFRARGISRPFAFLKKAGYSDNFASRIKNSKVSRLDLKHLERLCLILKCTPLDIMVWTPDRDVDLDESHPMNALRKTADEVDIVKTLSSVPIGKLERIEKLIKEEIERKTD